MFINFFDKKIEYNDFVKQYGEGFFNSLDLGLEKPDYEILKSIIYSENGFSGGTNN